MSGGGLHSRNGPCGETAAKAKPNENETARRPAAITTFIRDFIIYHQLKSYNMSKYNKFEDFMQTVINTADEYCMSRHGKSLADAYLVDKNITKMLTLIIGYGWWVFVALVAVLVLGPWAFAGASLAFIASPPGIIVVGALAVFGGAGAIRLLYKNRVLPLAVKETGEIYKDDFQRHEGQQAYIDGLVQSAAECLLRKATLLL